MTMCRIAPAVVLALTLGGHVLAQSYPAKPVRAIIPAGTGTPTDIAGRAIGLAISPHLGQQIIIDNRVGANGIIGIIGMASGIHDLQIAGSLQ